jgi:hypothetical protein
MPEPIIDDKKERKEDKPLGVEVREKSFQQILKEQQETRGKSVEEVAGETAEEKEEKRKQAEEKKAQDEQAAKAKEEADRKVEEERQAALAREAADAVLKKQAEAQKQEQEKVTAQEEEKQRQEALKPKFSALDKDGNPIPKSYEEIVDEGARIGEERALARVRAEQQEKDAQKAEEEAAKLKTEEQQRTAQKTAEDQLQTELDADLKDLYANNKLPKVKNPNDENDLGNKEFRNLFETAQKVNAARMAKGEQPIRSIKLIYYEHYKPLAKPAGHDAPVLGGESTISTEPPEDKYIVSRDRNKSITQLVKEEAARLTKRMNVRGK